MITRDQLMELRLRKPFSPFRIRLADGRAFELLRGSDFAIGQTIILIPQPHQAAARVKMGDIVALDVFETTPQ